jgi:glycosyltransferase involved in cell wall biosynthesis
MDYRLPFFQLLSDRFEIKFFFLESNASVPNVLDSIYASALGRTGIRGLANLTFLGFHDLLALYSGIRQSDVFATSNIWTSYSLIGLIFCKVLHKKVIVWEEWNVVFPGLRAAFMYALIRLFCRYVDAFFVLGEPQRKFLMNLGVEAERVFVANEYPGHIYSEVQPRNIPLPFDENTSIILYMGRLLEVKGVEFLLRAFSIVEKKYDNAALLIVGDGPLLEYLKNLARQLGIHRIHFTGWIADIYVKSYLFRRSCMVIVPSIHAKTSPRHEGGPMVVVEALSAGRPVISTDATPHCLAFIKDGINGYQVPQRNVEFLADRIMRLLDTPITPAQVLSTFHQIKGYEYQAEQFEKAVSYSLNRKVS